MCTQFSTHADAGVCDPSLRTLKVEVRDARVHLERLCQVAGSLIPNRSEWRCVGRLEYTTLQEYAISRYVRVRLRLAMLVFTLIESSTLPTPSSPMPLSVNVHAVKHTRRCRSM